MVCIKTEYNSMSLVRRDCRRAASSSSSSYVRKRKRKKGPARADADFFARHSEWMGCCLILSSFSHSLPIRVNDMWAPSRTHTPAHHAHLNRHTHAQTHRQREREKKSMHMFKDINGRRFLYTYSVVYTSYIEIVIYFSGGCLVVYAENITRATIYSS
jgi:hypothetical protein